MQSWLIEYSDPMGSGVGLLKEHANGSGAICYVVGRWVDQGREVWGGVFKLFPLLTLCVLTLCVLTPYTTEQ